MISKFIVYRELEFPIGFAIEKKYMKIYFRFNNIELIKDLVMKYLNISIKDLKINPTAKNKGYFLLNLPSKRLKQIIEILELGFLGNFSVRAIKNFGRLYR